MCPNVAVLYSLPLFLSLGPGSLFVSLELTSLKKPTNQPPNPKPAPFPCQRLYGSQWAFRNCLVCARPHQKQLCALLHQIVSRRLGNRTSATYTLQTRKLWLSNLWDSAKQSQQHDARQTRCSSEHGSPTCSGGEGENGTPVNWRVFQIHVHLDPQNIPYLEKGFL